jgi:hypothetical protein
MRVVAAECTSRKLATDVFLVVSTVFNTLKPVKRVWMKKNSRNQWQSMLAMQLGKFFSAWTVGVFLIIVRVLCYDSLSEVDELLEYRPKIVPCHLEN